jgi:type II secretory ATPase GspE/PulE/Tfp pilus assembly ATPase PilB-like protein
VRRITPNGYQGRIGIYQIMPGTTPSKNLKTLFDDGLIKVEKGLTTEEELARVISLEN